MKRRDLNQSFEDFLCLRQQTERQLCVSAFACVFWPALILASADRPIPRRQWHLALLVVWWRSLCEPLVRQPLAGHAVNEAIEAVERMNFDVAFVQPERKFVNVSAKMLLAGMVVNADDPALENRENALNAVRRDIIADIFTSAVIDRIVIECGADARIRAGFVRVQGRTCLNMLMYGGLDGFPIGAADRHRYSASTTLAHSKNRRLADRATARFELLVFVLILFDPADIGFVNFDDPAKFAQVLTAAGFPQTVEHEPSRFLRNPDFLGELHGRNALARRHKQVHRVNPLVQRNVAALEDRPGAHREVLFALVAAVEATSPCCDALAHTAHRATRAIGPKPPLKIRPGRFLVREHLKKLEG
jgi:hypothetical protein